MVGIADGDDDDDNSGNDDNDNDDDGGIMNPFWVQYRSV
jgi:hypothetical protein